MRLTTESVLRDIGVALKERKELVWSKTDQLLLKAQLHIDSLQRQLDHKELTDEEILEIWKEFDAKDVDNWFISSARALLKKASEK